MHSPSFHANDVKNFHDKFGLTTPSQLTMLSYELLEFRKKFFIEEISELMSALKNGDIYEAADACVDIIYITAGAALLSGILPDEFEKIVTTYGDHAEHIALSTTAKDPNTKHADFILKAWSNTVQELPEIYHQTNVRGDQARLFHTFANLYQYSLLIAGELDIDAALFDELWDDVQRANMSKERATDASQSKRGSSFDVIKPAGWKPAQTVDIINAAKKRFDPSLEA